MSFPPGSWVARRRAPAQPAKAPLLAYLIRFEGISWGTALAKEALLVAAWLTPVHLVIFTLFGVYRCLWAHASAVDLERLMAAAAASAGGAAGPSHPRAHPAPGPAANPRDERGPHRLRRRPASPDAADRRLEDLSRSDGTGRRLLIAGAGVAGRLILRDLLNNSRPSLEPVGFLDDDRRLHGQLLAGLPVLGALKHAGEIAVEHSATEIIIAMPSAPGRVIRQVVEGARIANVDTRIMPELSELLSSVTGRLQLRHVEIQDLLRREPVSVNVSQVLGVVSGLTVLVTGARGSIGGELCRQLAGLDRARIILVGHGENSIFEIYHELLATFPRHDIVPVIADVRDALRMHEILGTYRPSLVFHAAAHKHVPLMEENPIEAALSTS